jgi:hypothetical protein
MTYIVVSEHVINAGNGKRYKLGDVAQLGWVGTLHYGIRAIGSTLDLYGLEISMK